MIQIPQHTLKVEIQRPDARRHAYWTDLVALAPVSHVYYLLKRQNGHANFISLRAVTLASGRIGLTSLGGSYCKRRATFLKSDVAITADMELAGMRSTAFMANSFNLIPVTRVTAGSDSG